MTKTLMIAAAAILNNEGEMLLVRKRGTDAFMQPGGKIDEGETAEFALCRELKEELDLDVSSNEFEQIGTFKAKAANESDTVVEAQVFRLHHNGPFENQAEIDELMWFPSASRTDAILAPLTKDYVIPACGVAV